MTDRSAPHSLDELPPPTQPPLVAAAPPPGGRVPAAPPSHSDAAPPSPIATPAGSTALVVTVAGVVAVALAAAAGGAVWLPRGGDVDRGAAVTLGLIGAGCGLLLAGTLYLWAWRTGTMLLRRVRMGLADGSCRPR